MASSWGRIQQPASSGAMPRGGVRSYPTKPRFGSWDGTRFIVYHTQERKTFKVARLVCEAFHGPAPFPRAVAMHKDENSRNNAPDNLEWGTQKQNLNAPGFIEYCRARIGDKSPSIKGHAAKMQRFLDQMRGTP